MRVCARSRAEKGHELTVVLGEEARTGKYRRSGTWRLCRVGSVQVGLGPDGGADRTYQWVRVGKKTESKRTPPGPWPKLQGDSNHWLPGGTGQEILGWVRGPWVVLEDVAREK